ncbi:MAG: RNA polymerase-binding protein DksA [Holosporaceae bacterium]|jgi:DnaK suppressor protein|nr:RNA polymerase-binding protein DksA [Holosporaceae bacterium]
MVDKICELPSGYKPSEMEEFMSDLQREYFRRRLLAWKKDILLGAQAAIKHLQEEGEAYTDVADKACTEAELAYELKSKDRARKLIGKIESALLKIENGTYGYCEETGEPISLKRLEARPIATLSVEAQERHEKQERTQKDEE